MNKKDNIYGPGGNVSIIEPRVVAHSIVNAIRSLVPRDVALGLADSAYTSGVAMVRDTYPTYETDPGLAFLLDDKRQRRFMENNGYHIADDMDYGMVDKATKNLMLKTGKARIPIYQVGEDDIDPSKVVLVSTDQNVVKPYVGRTMNGEKPYLLHAGDYPSALYQDSESGDYYVRSWDLNDYGQHNGGLYDKLGAFLFNIDSSQSGNGTTYGARQILAEMYDLVGNPFVQRTGLVKVPPPPDRTEQLKAALRNIENLTKSLEGQEGGKANGGPLLLNPYVGGGPLGDGFPDFMTRNDDTRSYNTGVKAKGLKDRALRKELNEWESGPGAQLIRDSSLVKYINPRDLSISYIPEEIVPKEESKRTYGGGPAHIDMFTGLDKDSDEFISRLIYVGVDGETGAYIYLDPLTGLEELYDSYLEGTQDEGDLGLYASGGKIHIKPSKRGTFTAAAKKHGKSVQAFASQVLANKENYSPAMVKKANFARNAAKWHADGGPLDNTIDYTGIATTNHRKYNPDYISYIDTSLANANISPAKRASILANIIEESGGNPFALDDTGKFYGLLQWADDRYKVTGEKDPYKEIDNQVSHILNTLGNTTDKVSWTHGGTGSGYNSYKDAMTDFDSDDLATAMKGFTLGYVRPTGKMDSYNNRLKVAEQLLKRYNNTPLQKVTNLADRINKAYGGDMDAILRLIGSAKGGIR